MKRLFTASNVQFIILLTVSIIMTVFALLFKPFPTSLILLFQLLTTVGILEIRFAYQIARFHNRIHSIFNRRKSDSELDEPSDWAIVWTKVGGYLMLMPQLMIMFI